MRQFYMLGTAIFIGFTFFHLKFATELIWVGLFAYSAIMGLYGEIERHKAIFPIAGIIAHFALLIYLYQRIGWLELKETGWVTLFAWLLSLVWNSYLAIYWRKSSSANSP